MGLAPLATSPGDVTYLERTALSTSAVIRSRRPEEAALYSQLETVTVTKTESFLTAKVPAPMGTLVAEAMTLYSTTTFAQMRFEVALVEVHCEVAVLELGIYPENLTPVVESSVVLKMFKNLVRWVLQLVADLGQAVEPTQHSCLVAFSSTSSSKVKKKEPFLFPSSLVNQNGHAWVHRVERVLAGWKVHLPPADSKLTLC